MATSYEGFYGGGGSSFNPDYGNLTGYHLNASMLGFPGSPQSANQVQDTINAIKHGTKVFEVTMLQPDVGESIPTQHFEEMRALMKLTGVKPSVHGPLIDPAGFGERGWESGAREDGERRMFAAIEKAQILDPSGNLPFVIHAANGAPGTEWRPGNEKKGEGKYVMERGVAINQETGQAAPIKREFKIRPGHSELFDKGGEVIGRNKDGSYKYKYIEGEQGLLFDAEGSIDSINAGEWSNKLTEVAQMTKHVEEIMGAAPVYFRENYSNAVVSRDGKKIFEMGEGGKVKGELEFKDEQRGKYEQMQKADIFMQNAELSFAGAFGQAYKYGNEEQKKELKKLSEYYSNNSEAVGGYVPVEGDYASSILAPAQKHYILSESLKKLQEITDPNFKLGGAPELFKSGEDFAMEKAAETFGNLAAKSWDSWKEKAPVLAVENMMLGQYAFARAEDMKELIGKSRENFVKQLVERGVSEKKAKKLAEDKLGVTWDVGHLNLMRKKGFTTEDIVEQTKVISKDKSMVKHVHLTDNFGYADTHLVPGMGNVPIKSILEELEKTGRFDEMRKITEAGGIVQHFKKLPHSMTLAALGSPIYSMSGQGSWNQAVEMQGAYFGGYGNLNPATHHSYFGAGFTTMPVELGGQMAGGQSRFGGAPMA